MASARCMNDPVYGYMELEDEVVLRALDTPEFQRLRDCKQLGCTSFVFPSATHSRFEHCVGVSHLAGKVGRHLMRAQPELEITARDMTALQMAGLVHDLGHGPFSHVFDNLFLNRFDSTRGKHHEDLSEMMFEHMVDANSLDLDRDMIETVKALIRGDSKRSDERAFLFDIVANDRSGLDVDKFDYLTRDSYYLGMASGQFQADVLMANCRVVDGCLSYAAKTSFNVAETFQMRYSLWKKVYVHRTTIAAEYMLTDALVAAEPVLKLTEAVFDGEQYCKLTDGIVREIERSTDPDLAESRAILARLRKRQLYKLVGEALLPAGCGKTEVKDVDVVNMCGDAGLRAEDIVVQNLKINYGKANKNPVDNVHFFKKTLSGEYKSFHMDTRSTISALTPSVYEEYYLRVYLKDPTNKAKLEAAIKGFNRYVDELKAHTHPGYGSVAGTSPAARDKARPRVSSPVTPLPGNSIGQRNIRNAKDADEQERKTNKTKKKKKRPHLLFPPDPPNEDDTDAATRTRKKRKQHANAQPMDEEKEEEEEEEEEEAEDIVGTGEMFDFSQNSNVSNDEQ